MALLEEAAPGTKQQMYFGFLRNAAHRFEGDSGAGDLVSCSVCGGPTVGWGREDPVCSFCKTKALAQRRRTPESNHG
jgi:hypothetical protein